MTMFDCTRLFIRLRVYHVLECDYDIMGECERNLCYAGCMRGIYVTERNLCYAGCMRGIYVTMNMLDVESVLCIHVCRAMHI